MKLYDANFWCRRHSNQINYKIIKSTEKSKCSIRPFQTFIYKFRQLPKIKKSLKRSTYC